MDLTTLLGMLARWGGTAAGGYLATHGYTAGDESQAIGGAILTILTLAWSAWQKIQQKKAVKTALMTPVPTKE